MINNNKRAIVTSTATTGRLTRQRRMRHVSTKASTKLFCGTKFEKDDWKTAAVDKRWQRLTSPNAVPHSQGEGISEHLDVCSDLEDTIRQHGGILEGRAWLYWTSSHRIPDLPRTSVY